MQWNFADTARSPWSDTTLLVVNVVDACFFVRFRSTVTKCQDGGAWETPRPMVWKTSWNTTQSLALWRDVLGTNGRWRNYWMYILHGDIWSQDPMARWRLATITSHLCSWRESTRYSESGSTVPKRGKRGTRIPYDPTYKTSIVLVLYDM